MPNTPDRPPDHKPVSRRDAIRAASAVALAGIARPAFAEHGTTPARAVTRGRIRQSVSRWCYQKMPLPDLCKAIAALGVAGDRSARGG